MSEEQKKERGHIEVIQPDEKDPDTNIVLKINYTESETSFGYVNEPNTLFMRTIRRNNKVEQEQIYINFMIERKFHNVFFIKLILLSEFL
ncbi:hypothetical protein WJ752_004604 [Salmonella enterica]